MTVELDPEGRPVAVRRSAGPPDRLAVDAVLETWRLDDEWWRVAIVRRYHDVMLEGGKHVMLFEDLTNGSWWMQKP
ncbi:MAG TPA: hypothetical protein VI160_02385 [Gemmatimonadales bacterium]